MANSNFASWNFLEFLFLYSFDPQLVELADAELTDTEGQLNCTSAFYPKILQGSLYQ